MEESDMKLNMNLLNFPALLCESAAGVPHFSTVYPQDSVENSSEIIRSSPCLFSSSQAENRIFPPALPLKQQDSALEKYLLLNNICQQVASNIAGVDSLVRDVYEKSVTWNLMGISSTLDKQSILYSVQENVASRMHSLCGLLSQASCAVNKFIQIVRQEVGNWENGMGEIQSQKYSGDSAPFGPSLPYDYSNPALNDGEMLTSLAVHESGSLASSSINSCGGSSSNNINDDVGFDSSMPRSPDTDANDKCDIESLPSVCSTSSLEAAMSSLGDTQTCKPKVDTFSYASALKLQSNNAASPKRGTLESAEWNRIPDGDMVEFFWKKLQKFGKSKITSLTSVISCLPDGGKSFMERIKVRYGSFLLFFLTHTSYFTLHGENHVDAKSSNPELVSKQCSEINFVDQGKLVCERAEADASGGNVLQPPAGMKRDCNTTVDDDMVEYFWIRLQNKQETKLTSLLGLVSCMPDGGKQYMHRIKVKYGGFKQFLTCHDSHFSLHGDNYVEARKSAGNVVPGKKPMSKILQNCKDHSRLYHEWKRSGYGFDLGLFESEEFRKQYAKANCKFEKDRMESVFLYLSRVFSLRNVIKHSSCFISFGCGPGADLEGMAELVKTGQIGRAGAKLIGYDIVDWSGQVAPQSGIAFYRDDVTRAEFLDKCSFPPHPNDAGSSVVVISYLAAAIKLHQEKYKTWWEELKRCSLIVVVDVNDNSLNRFLEQINFTKYEYGTTQVPVHVYHKTS